MNRRTFAKGLAISWLGLTFSEDSSIDRNSTDRPDRDDKNNQQSKYDKVIRKIKENGIETHSEYSIDRVSDNILIFIPDKHKYEIHKEQKALINKLMKAGVLDCLGVEGIYEDINEELVRKVKTGREIYQRLLQENAAQYKLAINAIKLLGGNGKESQGLQEKLNGLSNTILMLQLDKEYVRHQTVPGFNFIEEFYGKIQLFPLEETEAYTFERKNLYKDLQIYAISEIRPFIKMLDKYNKTRAKTGEDTPNIQKFMDYIELLKRIVDNNCKEHKDEKQEVLEILLEQHGIQYIQNIPQRNRAWLYNAHEQDHKHNLIGVIGGGAHIVDLYNQEREYSIITINNGIQLNLE